MKKVDVCIIGGGASGLVSAILSKGRVALIEKSDRVGKKILLTGNGRCNFSNIDLDKKYYSSPDFYQAVYDNNIEDLDELISSIGLFKRADSAGRIYPHSNHASSVLDALRYSAEKNAEILTSVKALLIKPVGKKYEIETDSESLLADKVIYAVGGGVFEPLSMLDIKINRTCPMLCAIDTETDKIKGLDGARANARMSLYRDGELIYQESGEILFRQYGVSGVGIFNCSAYIARDKVKGVKGEYKIGIDLLDGLEGNSVRSTLLKRAEQSVPAEQIFAGLTLRKIGERILKNLAIPFDKALTKNEVEQVYKALTCFELKVKRLHEDGAQVLSGGIDIHEINQNLELRKYPNLFVVGEAVDMDGLCGGYNLNWAFLSAVGACK